MLKGSAVDLALMFANIINGKYKGALAEWPGADRGLLYAVPTTMGGFEPSTFRFESDITNPCATEAAHFQGSRTQFLIRFFGFWAFASSLSAIYFAEVERERTTAFVISVFALNVYRASPGLVSIVESPFG